MTQKIILGRNLKLKSLDTLYSDCLLEEISLIFLG